MNLGKRLELIARLIPENSRLADVGTDHGYIPIFCVKNNISTSALAMDVNDGPLLSAQKNIQKYGLEDKITTRISNGLENLNKDEVNVIVIAGMGGLLIMDIIDRGYDVITSDTLLILQPMLAVKELREFLYNKGFSVMEEYVCRDDNKFYNILTVKKEKIDYSLKDVVVGKNISKNSPDVYKDYLEYKLRILNNIADGMKKSSSYNESELDEVLQDINLYEKEIEQL